MAVTGNERKQAVKQANDTHIVQTLAVRAAAKLAAKAQLVAYRLLRQKRYDDIPANVRNEFLGLKDELTEALLYAYLVGKKRLTVGASFSAMSSAVKTLLKKVNMTADELDALRVRFGSNAVDILTNESDFIESRLRKSLANILEQNMHVSEAKSALQSTFDSLGITPNNSFQLEAIFRTQTQMAYSAAKWIEAQDGPIAEVLWGWKYVTVGDDRVRPEHEALDGTTLPKDDLFWTRNFPPNGWACRCQVIEVFEKRDIVRPPGTVELPNGKVVQTGADAGFDFNPGQVLLAV